MTGCGLITYCQGMGAATAGKMSHLLLLLCACSLPVRGGRGQGAEDRGRGRATWVGQGGRSRAGQDEGRIRGGQEGGSGRAGQELVWVESLPGEVVGVEARSEGGDLLARVRKGLV